MRFLAFIVLISALAIAGCAAYFSIVGLTLLFVGSGVSIIVMGTTLEVGKFIAVTFLKQKWDEIGLALKGYLIVATLVLMAITSIGIYGYLSAGYNATSIKVQGFEQQITGNLKKIDNLKLDNVKITEDPLNQKEIELINTNKNNFIVQQIKLIEQKETKIKEVRDGNTSDKKSSDDMAAAKVALDAEKVTLDSEISKEIDQIKLYNNRLQILDKEVQTWLDQGSGGFFKENGMDKARVVKGQQEKERAQIDTQIQERQNRIESLRAEYKQQVANYTARITGIETRLATQTNTVEQITKVLDKEINDIRQGIDTYNKSAEVAVSEQIAKKEQIIKDNKSKIITNEDIVQKILTANNEIKEQINHTDVGTFKFVASSIGLTLDETVTYFIWAIILVFDPLAVCLVLCFNYLIKDTSSKKKAKEPIVESVSVPTPTPTSTPSTLPIEVKVKELVDIPTPQTRKVHEDQISRMAAILEVQRQEKASRKHNPIEEAYNTEK
jgi:hypothetical protein